MFFILDNTRNFEDRAKKQASCFGDDCGVWESDSGTSPKFYYILNSDGSLSTVFLRQEQYCVRKVVQKKVVYVPVTPQSGKTHVVVVHRYYTVSKLDKTYKKRIT